jgi:hypothetical protein
MTVPGSGAVAREKTDAKSLGLWGAEAFTAGAEGLHSGTAQAAGNTLPFSPVAFGLRADISCAKYRAQ